MESLGTCFLSHVASESMLKQIFDESGGFYSKNFQDHIEILFKLKETSSGLMFKLKGTARGELVWP